MAEPFIGEIRIFGFNYPPRGWASCQGQLLPIAQNSTLFSVIGTYYGGDGKVTMALPNLVGSIPIGVSIPGSPIAYSLGEIGGANQVSLAPTEMAAHSHIPNCNTNPAETESPVGNVWAADGASANQYYGLPAKAGMAPTAIQAVGSGQAHENRMPFLVLNFCIAMSGVFPARN